jgi:hypothetical protein
MGGAGRPALQGPTRLNLKITVCRAVIHGAEHKLDRTPTGNDPDVGRNQTQRRQLVSRAPEESFLLESAKRFPY